MTPRSPAPLAFASGGLSIVLALTISLLFGATRLAAQAPNAKTPPPQSLSFFTLNNVENPPAELAFTVFVAGRPVDLRLPVGAMSEPLIRPQGPGIVLHQTQPRRPEKTASASHSPVPPEIARADFPSTWKNILVLVAASPSGDKVQLRVYDVSEATLPGATLGLYNLTGRDLAVQLNKTQALARSNSLTPIPLVTRPDRESGMFQLKVALQAEGAWKLAARQSFSLSKAARNFALAVPAGESIDLIYFHPPADPVIEPDPAGPSPRN